jgi:hypothetical protein
MTKFVLLGFFRKPFSISALSVALLTFHTAATFSAQWASDSPRRPSDPVRRRDSATVPSDPSYGVQDPSVLTLFAWDFHSVDDRIVTGPTAAGSYLRYVVSSTAPFPGGYLEAGVHLPAGSLIEAIELTGCDTNPAADMTAALYYTDDPWGVSELIGAVASGGAGLEDCFSTTATTAHTVDNGDNSYAVEINLPVGDPSVGLRALRIHYRLQVSPPPSLPTFGDVPPGHNLFQFVEALAASGITAGCGNGDFCPNAPLTRGQMAVFLAKALGLHWSN